MKDKDYYVAQLGRHANPYFLEAVRRIASDMWDEAFQAGQAAPRKRGPKPTKAQQEAADEHTQLSQELGDD